MPGPRRATGSPLLTPTRLMQPGVPPPPSRAGGPRARTAIRANEGSWFVRPTRNSTTSNSPPPSTTRSNTRRRMSESIRCPSRTTVSWTTSGSSELGEREPLLRLVLASLVRVGDLAGLVALEEEHLCDALPGVDPRREGRRVRDLEGDDALPLGLEGGHVHDDAAARVRGLSKTAHDHVTRDAEVLHRAGEGEGVGRDDALLTLQ